MKMMILMLMAMMRILMLMMTVKVMLMTNMVMMMTMLVTIVHRAAVHATCMYGRILMSIFVFMIGIVNPPPPPPTLATLSTKLTPRAHY